MNAKLNARAAQIMGQFNSSAAKLNNGTIVIGGRVEAPTARKLVRLGLIEQVRDSRVIYRATAAGREWLAEQDGTTHEVRTAIAETEAASWPHVEITETPAPLDIPAAVREYIEAEYRGAALVMSAKRGEITAALLAADPSLSETAATFRFHNLVDEHRGNGEISADTLARITPAAAEPTEASRSWGAAFAAVTAKDAPQYVSVADEQGGVWHLVDADGNPVAAGEHTAKDGDRFTIAATPEAYFGLSVNEAPRTVEITWLIIAGKPRSKRQSGVFGAYVDMLITGWHWQAERV